MLRLGILWMAIGAAGVWAQSSPISELKYVSVADLRSQPPPTRPCYAEVQGYSWPGDGGGGFFFWDGKCTEADEGGAYFKAEGADEGRWFRILAGKRASVLMWGARGDGKTDDAPAIQRALDFVSKAGFTLLEFPPAIYALNRWIEPAGNAAWRYTHLALGRQAGPPVQLTMRGPGATLLSVANGPEVNSSRNTILQIYENIKEFRAEGLTFERRMDPGTQQFRQGVNVTDNSGESVILKEVPTDLIGFYDCTFIDCQRALTVNRAIVSQGINCLDVVRCRFLYPKGSNSTRKDGGSQVALAGCDVENLNCSDSYAEGCSEQGLNSPNGLPIDGFWFGTGRRAIIKGCTLTRFWFEGIYAMNLEPAIYIEKLNVPAEGEVVEISIPKGTTKEVLSLFGVGKKVYINKHNGYYTIESADLLRLQLRREAAISTMIGQANPGTEAKGVFCRLVGGTEDISTTVTDCIFEGGSVNGMEKQENSLDPAIRIEVGQCVLTDNIFIKNNRCVVLCMDESSPNAQKGTIISGNIFQSAGTYHGGGKQPYLLMSDIIGGIIENNGFTFDHPESENPLWGMQVAFGNGGKTVLRGNTFRMVEGDTTKVNAIGRVFKDGSKIVAEGNIFDGVMPGAVEDPAAGLIGENTNLQPTK